jgi:DNA-binding NtrC family response regulator
VTILSNPKILLVDDEEAFRTALSERLRVRGLDTTAVGTGREALKEIKKTLYDVILLDIKMPEMNGMEALAEIKKINPFIEVIILSGHASVDAAVEITKLGGYDYLLKPCPFDELLEKIDEAYERKIAREKRNIKA